MIVEDDKEVCLHSVDVTSNSFHVTIKIIGIKQIPSHYTVNMFWSSSVYKK